jgi:hypothetical protein
MRSRSASEPTSLITTASQSVDGTHPNGAREDGPVDSGCRLVMLLTEIVFFRHLTLILLCPISVGLNGSLTVFMVCCTCSGPFFFRCFALNPALFFHQCPSRWLADGLRDNGVPVQALPKERLLSTPDNPDSLPPLYEALHFAGRKIDKGIFGQERKRLEDQARFSSK